MQACIIKKSTAGAAGNIAAAVAYVSKESQGNDKIIILRPHLVRESDPEKIGREFAACSAVAGCQRAGYSFVLSLGVDGSALAESKSAAEVGKLVQRWLYRSGLGGHKVFAALHRKGEASHIHLIISAASVDGKHKITGRQKEHYSFCCAWRDTLAEHGVRQEVRIRPDGEKIKRGKNRAARAHAGQRCCRRAATVAAWLRGRAGLPVPLMPYSNGKSYGAQLEQNRAALTAAAGALRAAHAQRRDLRRVWPTAGGMVADFAALIGGGERGGMAAAWAALLREAGVADRRRAAKKLTELQKEIDTQAAALRRGTFERER